MLGMKESLDIIQSHQKNIPVMTIPLAEELGLKVYDVPNWPKGLSGMVKKNLDRKGGFDIFINKSHPARRRRFTIAHEIAHVVLHPDMIGDGITENGLLRASGLSNAVEAQANRLAADILMPREQLEKYLADLEEPNIKELADIFDVSEQAMAIRLGVPQ